jgi:hypothetical protein
VERLCEFVREVADVGILRSYDHPDSHKYKEVVRRMEERVNKARAIVADLPKTIDPDVLEARQIVYEIYDYKGYLSGQYDKRPEMLTALAAIKRGRELAQQVRTHA